MLFFHVLAVLHSPSYCADNGGALRQDWPRIPLPATREALEASSALGRQIAALLDVTQPVKGVTAGKIGPELKTIGLITHVEGKRINDADDLAVTAGWGNPGRGGITMPATGDARRREYTTEESVGRAGPSDPLDLPAGGHADGPCAGKPARPTPVRPDSVAQPPSAVRPHQEEDSCPLGQTTFDIYLNDSVYWRNIPSVVWEYTLGGYQVIKKWLSYREHKMLNRPLRADEARHVTEMARRIAAILMMRAALDENYAKVKSGTCPAFGGNGQR
jgi:hypothetical protein